MRILGKKKKKKANDGGCRQSSFSTPPSVSSQIARNNVCIEDSEINPGKFARNENTRETESNVLYHRSMLAYPLITTLSKSRTKFQLDHGWSDDDSTLISEITMPSTRPDKTAGKTSQDADSVTEEFVSLVKMLYGETTSTFDDFQSPLCPYGPNKYPMKIAACREDDRNACSFYVATPSGETVVSDLGDLDSPSMIAAKKVLARHSKPQRHDECETQYSGSHQTHPSTVFSDSSDTSGWVSETRVPEDVESEMDGNMIAREISERGGWRHSFDDEISTFRDEMEKPYGSSDIGQHQFEYEDLRSMASETRQKIKYLQKEQERLLKLIMQSRDPLQRECLGMKRADLLHTILSLELESVGPSHPTLARTTLTKGQNLVEMGDREGLLHMKEAISMYRLALGNDHPDVGRALVKLALAYIEKKAENIKIFGEDQFENDICEAILSLREAVKILRSMEADAVELGVVLHLLGSAFKCSGQYGKAMNAFSAASACFGGRHGLIRRRGRESLASLSDGIHHEMMASIWIDIGELLFYRKQDVENAQDALEFGLTVLDQNMREKEMRGRSSDVRRTGTDSAICIVAERTPFEDDVLSARALQLIARVHAERGWSTKAESGHLAALRIAAKCKEHLEETNIICKKDVAEKLATILNNAE